MKKGMMIFSILVVAAVVSVFFPMVASANNICGWNGCRKEGGCNGTVFCKTHAAEYAKEEGLVFCGAARCTKYVTKSSRYCYTHQCRKSGCNNQKMSGSDYCSSHQPKKNTNSVSAGKRSSYSSTGSKKKYDTYNVYSYKDAQSFADDKYEEFYDYEDDYEDEDEAYDAAVDYWYDHN